MLLLFFFVWVLFNGRITTEIVIFGLVIAAVVFAFICRFMDYSLQKEKLLYMKLVTFGSYVCLLIKEIILANLVAIRLILTRKEVMEPVLVKFRTNLKSETLRVILANSITLTPGTITVTMEDNELTVHCLDKSLAEGIEDSVFVKMLEKMEGRAEKWN